MNEMCAAKGLRGAIVIALLFGARSSIAEEPVVPPTVRDASCAACRRSESGYAKKTVGAVLITLGAAIQVGGFALVAGATLNTPGACGQLATSDVLSSACGAQWIGGALVLLAGALLTEIGIVVYGVGGAQMRRALLPR